MCECKYFVIQSIYLSVVASAGAVFAGRTGTMFPANTAPTLLGTFRTFYHRVVPGGRTGTMFPAGTTLLFALNCAIINSELGSEMSHLFEKFFLFSQLSYYM